MTYIKLSGYVLSSSLTPKKADEKLKELIQEAVLDSEEAFNLESFVEDVCSSMDDHEGPDFSLLDSEDIAVQRQIDSEGCIEYSDEDIDTMVNDILYDTAEDDDVYSIDEEDEDSEESEDFEESFDDEED